MSGRAVMAVAITAQGATFSAAVFDTSPDGSYFAMVEADPDARATQIHVVVNWIKELKRLAPTR